MRPSSRRPSRSSFPKDGTSALPMTSAPIRLICCARAANGNAVAPPSRVIKSRRFILAFPNAKYYQAMNGFKYQAITCSGTIQYRRPATERPAPGETDTAFATGYWGSKGRREAPTDDETPQSKPKYRSGSIAKFRDVLKASEPPGLTLTAR